MHEPGKSSGRQNFAAILYCQAAGPRFPAKGPERRRAGRIGQTALTEHQRARFQEGIGLFNRGRFFDCHEVLEEVWLELSGNRKKFLQGLIQLTVAFHHLQNGNRVGAGRLLAAAVEKLSLDSLERTLLDIETLLAEVQPLREQLAGGGSGEPAAPPQIRWKEPPATPRGSQKSALESDRR